MQELINNIKEWVKLDNEIQQLDKQIDGKENFINDGFED